MAAICHHGLLKLELFNGRSGQETHFALAYQISYTSVKPLRRHRDFCDFFFKMSVVILIFF